MEILITEPLLARIGGAHFDFVGDIPPQSVPLDASLLGVPWAAQYIVLGAGFADFSQTVHGIITQCP